MTTQTEEAAMEMPAALRRFRTVEDMTLAHHDEWLYLTNHTLPVRPPTEEEAARYAARAPDWSDLYEPGEPQLLALRPAEAAAPPEVIVPDPLPKRTPPADREPGQGEDKAVPVSESVQVTEPGQKDITEDSDPAADEAEEASRATLARWTGGKTIAPGPVADVLGAVTQLLGPEPADDWAGGIQPDPETAVLVEQARQDEASETAEATSVLPAAEDDTAVTS